MPTKSRRKLVRWVIACVVAVLICAIIPPVHFVRLDAHSTRSDTGSKQPFSADSFAKEFWQQRLLPAIAQACDATTLLSETQRDPKAAREKYGRSVGLGSSYYFFVRGSGRLISRKNDSVGLRIGDATGDSPDLIIDTGKIFGNAIRDGTGLLNVNDFPNSRDFNDLASALNGIVETSVAPTVRAASMGSEVRFAGVIEVNDEQLDLHPPHVIPVQAEVR